MTNPENENLHEIARKGCGDKNCSRPIVLQEDGHWLWYDKENDEYRLMHYGCKPPVKKTKSEHGLHSFRQIPPDKQS